MRKLNGMEHKNSENCTVTEFGNIGNADFSEAKIEGRYPEGGYALNRESDMIIRVISGVGKVAIRDVVIELNIGDVVKIDKNTAYYYIGSDLQIVMICSPPWRPEQYETVFIA